MNVHLVPQATVPEDHVLPLTSRSGVEIRKVRLSADLPEALIEELKRLTALELDSEHGGRADQWHTDVTFVPACPKYAVPRGAVIPDTGGDTVRADTAAAADGARSRAIRP